MSLCKRISLILILAAMGLDVRAQGEQTLYRKSMSDGREVVVMKSATMPVAALGDLLSPDPVNRRSHLAAVGFLSLSIEVHVPTKAPLVMWSLMFPLYSATADTEFGVLDLLVLPGRVVAAIASPDATIDVYDIPFGRVAQGAGLPAYEWSLLGAAIPAAPGRLGTKLNYNEGDKCIEAEVTDYLQNTKQHTLFRQKTDKWEFVQVKRWQETLPATRPVKRE